jgi:multiple sugar transport system substrate-binding protein
MKISAKRASFVALLSTLLVGCVSQEQQPAAQSPIKSANEKTEPITITFFNPFSSISSDYVKSNIEMPIQKAFPHITFKYVEGGNGTSLEKLVAAGAVPDIIFGTITNFVQYNELDLVEDLTPLIKKHNLDLSKLEDGVIDTIKAYSGNGTIPAIPWGLNQSSLYYNKDIFDKFGIPYPKDGMSWEQVANLVKQVSRTDGNVKIRGLDMNYSHMISFNQLSAFFVDPKTEKAAVNNDTWQSLFKELSDLYKITGNDVADNSKSDTEAFMNERSIAMRVGQSMFPALMALDSNGQSFNWDIVSIPYFKAKPDVGTQANITTLAIAKQSKHKDELMGIMKLMLSDEVQTQGSMIARQTVMKSAAIKNKFGQESKMMLTKNIAAVSKPKIAPTVNVTKYDSIAKSTLNRKFDEVRKGKKDVNTALREAEEEINKKIEEEKLKQTS